MVPRIQSGMGSGPCHDRDDGRWRSSANGLAGAIHSVGWPWSFGVFGIIGLGWAAAFYLWFRDNPADHPATNQAKRQLIAEEDDSPRKHCPSIPNH